MKFGVNLLNFGPGVSAESIGRWGQVVEALGYHGIFISDHVAITPSVAPRYPEPYFDALITLSYLAAQTKRVDLGTTVIVLPYRHPVLLAHHVANLDLLSGGRAILGVGVGNAADEFAVVGARHDRRGAWSDDVLEALRALWTGSGEVTHHGRYIQFDRVSAVATKQRPYPPIWVGGNSGAAVRRAVRFGAGWHPINQSVTMLREQGIPALRRAAEAAGKPLPPLHPRIRLRITPDPLDEADRSPGHGTIEQIHGDLAGLRDLGAEYVVLDWYNGPDALEDTKDHERAFAMLATLAEQVIDLPSGTLR